jgi:transposase
MSRIPCGRRRNGTKHAARKNARPPRKGRRGRFTTADKIAQAERSEDIVPRGLDKCDCQLSQTRPVWRLENGRAMLIAYRIYRGPNNQYGKVPDVLGRSEFGLEIVITIAFLAYVVGLSFDKVCLMLNFFQHLKLSKSQADALLHQLSRHWQNEFETLCTLLANSAVVHADETSWSLNSVRAFLSEKARVLFLVVHKDADTLRQLLDPATFAGIVISDDAAVYVNFTAMQKCWAHLRRKAIKLTLHEPNNPEYREFADRLVEIYRTSRRMQRDARLGDAGRARKIAELDDEILELCGPPWAAELSPCEGPDNDYGLLANEVMRLMLAQELFTFVAAKPVEQPNGETQTVGPQTAKPNERFVQREKPTSRRTARRHEQLVHQR